ncbi:gamma-glutamyltransferase [Acuticoccus sp. I52.16.1]|uniref:gamma-glutamyltransferase n=1 Tax=Acuticoccus sp. I52.16.1 TaxID=2928472 RepID=UPI001FD37815|nr:gamma-glutamyltransferase [Acuticoccus sp. I52.16.1]UOM36912.1 gamma-glutamyltransferase [Acuticoccus sp. I52.16.1]
MADGWRQRSPVDFVCEKAPAVGSTGMVVTNHPLGSAAGAEMLAAGGNAVDAAVASLLALTVVEPMMVGIAGGGLSHLRLADGRHIVVDALAAAPAATHAETFQPVSDEPARRMDTVGDRSARGPAAVAVPANLLGWHSMHTRFGKLPFADVVEPAIRLAAGGFRLTHYLAGAIAEHAGELSGDPEIAALFVPDGRPRAAGERLVQGAYADSLRLVARDGAAALHGGPLGAALAARIHRGAADDGYLTEADLAGARAIDRPPIVGTYRGYEIVGPPPPASSGVHVVEMLNILEGFDVAGLGFGTPDALHLLAEVLTIGFADRRLSSGDPDFVDVPVDRLISKAYAAARRAEIGGVRAAEPAVPGSADTTHVTVADRDGNIVSATHTINGLFGAKFVVPGAGFIPNNYMMNFDPHPGRALSVAPGKRVPTSMAPMIVTKGGRPAFALGLPGALRIFPSAFQAIVNLIDHGMSLQEAVEAPRLFTEGHVLELEAGYAGARSALEAMGYEIAIVPHVAGGMNAVGFEAGGTMTGAACWRADGTALAMGGGLARPGVRFYTGTAPDTPDAPTEAAPQ